MDTVTPTTDVVVTDAEIVELETNSFAKETGKTLLTATATSAGVLAGIYLVSVAADKVNKFRANRKAKAAEEKVHVVTNLPQTETAEN